MNIIHNGNEVMLNQNSGTLPQMDGALLGWMQPITFEQITKSVIGFQNKEVAASFSFEGVWMQLSPEQLSMKEIGQRSWPWFQVYSQLAVPLNTDDVITYQGTQYRVMAKEDWSLLGFYRLELVKDYSGSGP